MALLVGALTLVLLHRPIFSAMYSFLTITEDAGPVALVVVTGADRLGLDRAQEIVAGGDAEGVLIVERRLPRITQIGVTPRPGDLIRDELVARGVSDSLVTNFPTDAVTNWQVVRELDQYLSRVAPDRKVAMLCPQHHGRHLRWVIDHVVDDARLGRYQLRTFAGGNFDQTNWWANRSALVKVAVGYLRLFHAIGFGEGEFDDDNWNPDAYQRSITRNLATAA